jgi:two-component system NtrC family sensor kinase
MKSETAKRLDAQISHHKSAEDFRILSHQILSSANRGLFRVDFLKEVSALLLAFSKCDTIELRLREDGEQARCEVVVRTKHSFTFENIPCVSSNNQQDKGIGIECQSLISDQFDSALSTFTDKGSFWIGNTSVLCVRKSSKVSACNLKIEKKYKSLALIPLVVGNENTGILLLKSRNEDFFTKKEIEFYENSAQTLGLALINQRAQAALRERIKELTCLYGIARIVERPGVSLDDILQNTANLLPPAWQYPEIAHGRIILNEHIYSSPGFRTGPYRQKANIMVKGKTIGFVEVVYSKKRPKLDEGPFLKEERSLIDAIAKEIALIVERRQTEEDKASLQEQLRHADRLATIGQLAAGVAHELNEPLANILGFAQLAKKNPSLPKQEIHDIEKIVTASLHAREIVKKLLLFARQMPTRRTTVDLNKIIEESLDFLESRCAKEEIRLIKLLDPTLPRITADQAQLTQVLVNLVVNAIQSMPKGGELTIQTISTDNHVLFIVQDTGTGMSEETMKQIFLPFFTTKEVGQGTGLGLSVVHGIVTSHGGTISVSSKIGHGSRFEIQLPVSEEPVEKD